jgi:hypothetical protein
MVTAEAVSPRACWKKWAFCAADMQLERLKSTSRLHPEIPRIAPRTPVQFFEHILPLQMEGESAGDTGRAIP